VQCSAVQCSAVQCSAVQCSAVKCSAVQCRGVQCSEVQCSAVQCSAVQCSAVQCSAVQWDRVKYKGMSRVRSAVQCSAPIETVTMSHKPSSHQQAEHKSTLNLFYHLSVVLSWWKVCPKQKLKGSPTAWRSARCPCRAHTECRRPQAMLCLIFCRYLLSIQWRNKMANLYIRGTQ
jgi:hypothetical protein